MGSRIRNAVLLAVAGFLLAPATGSAGGGPGDSGTFGYGPHVAEARALGYCKRLELTLPSYRACLVDLAYLLVLKTGDPARELPRIDAYVHSVGGWLESNCHSLMHAVGRRYGKREHVTLTGLLKYLPRTNDPGCSAGFAHGLLIALGPQIERLGPKGAAAECRQAPTRYRRYSCIHGLGHAYARQFSDFVEPALASCRKLGPDTLDCAQGVFHDYWIAAAGLDGASPRAGLPVTPRALCEPQPATFARVCWYRAFLERPPVRLPRTAAELVSLCRGLASQQRSGCLTGASLIRSPDPFEQMRTCAELRAGDAVSCVRGVRVPAVAFAQFTLGLRLIKLCAVFDRAAQRGCYTWLAKALNVLADGRFETRGCPKLFYPTTRAACIEGARSYEAALETFS